jgi:hypothetical protein
MCLEGDEVERRHRCDKRLEERRAIMAVRQGGQLKFTVGSMKGEDGDNA